MKYTINHLPKEKWENNVLTIGTNPIELYNGQFQEACAWGVLDNGHLIAAIETCPDEGENRLRITALWVDMPHRNNGLGHALLEVAKEQAIHENRRAITLKTQSQNVNATQFFQHEGFVFIQKTDELGWSPKRNERLSRNDVEIRQERPDDYYPVEHMLQKAFWNKFQPGCDDHLVVHKLRALDAYLPELSRIAVKDGKVLGAIFYSRAFVRDGDTHHEVLTFGPLGVLQSWRGSGVGEMLLRETMKLAADAGYPGIIIYGVPAYYPNFGFKTCDHFGITSWEGKNFDAFMGIELKPNGFADVLGRFYQSKVFEPIPAEEADAYNALFPPLEKQYFPKQF